MTAQSENRDGSRRFRLGAVEVSVIVLAITIGWWLVWQLVSAQYSAQMKANSDTANAIVGMRTQIAVMSDQIATLTTQLADIPTLSRTQAQIQAEQADHERRIERLENDHGARVKGWTH